MTLPSFPPGDDPGPSFSTLLRRSGQEALRVQADATFAGRLFQEEVCEESDPAKHKSALEKYGAAMDKLDAKNICSQSCLSRPNRDALGTNVLGRIESGNQVAYPCP